jgi:hypothetical protein
LWSIFERDVDLFRRQDRTDITARLLIAGSNDSRPALVTRPDHPMRASSNPTNCNLHTRPRLGSIDISTLPQAQQAHGGLSPRAMRRVREYVHRQTGAKISASARHSSERDRHGRTCRLTAHETPIFLEPPAGRYG